MIDDDAPVTPSLAQATRGLTPAKVAEYMHDPLPRENFTELGVANRLVKQYGTHMRYVHEWGFWLRFNGTVWEKDPGGTFAYARAVDTVRGMQHRAVEMSSDDPMKEPTEAVSKKMQTDRGFSALLNICKRDKNIACAPTDFDADPMLLNTPDGVLDLRTFELTLGHRPGDMMMKITTGNYRSDSPGGAFSMFLENIQPDEEMRDFLGRLMSQGLSGSTTEHILPIFYGSGANGKTTLTEAVRNALGNYAQTVDPELLIDKSNKHLTGVADLLGCRLALAAETEANENLAESTVKRLTGGDTLKARYMRQDLFEFTPTHTLIMSTNHRPKVRGQDEGIWRRLRLCPFLVNIPADEQDPELPMKLEAAADEVVTWLVKGYRDYKERGGLREPQIVRVATDEYRSEENALTRWLGECCEIKEGAVTLASELYQSWTKWAMDERIDSDDHLSQSHFGKALEKLGYTKGPQRQGKVTRLGLKLHGEIVT